MINLLQTTSPQTIAFIPRLDNAPVTIVVTSETSGVQNTYTPVFYLDRFYKTATLVFDLNENEFYSLLIKDVDGIEIYNDSVFCTNQNLDDFTINKDTYIYG